MDELNKLEAVPTIHALVKEEPIIEVKTVEPVVEEAPAPLKVEAPAPGQQLLISPPRKPAAVVAEKAPETMPTEQDEFDLLAA